ncbi:MAG: glycosyl transferase [Saprospiraceae bacterium]|nr:MAG: glycosyl transferase [Saprospiraceae bacterium]
MSHANQKGLKIGISGCRGIPNHYGGYEQFAQYLSEGLLQRGHQVFVYQSSLHPYTQNQWQGVQLLRKFDPEDKLGPFGQFIYDFNCLIDAKKRNFDVLLQLGYTSNTIWYPLWDRRAVQVLHLDGLEWKRSKYGPLTQRFLKKMEAIATHQADVLIADSPVIQSHTRQQYGRKAIFIAYGANAQPQTDKKHLDTFNLTPGQYFLAIARFVPENNLHTIIEGYLKSAQKHPLVLVGSTQTKYGKELFQKYQDKNILFAGALFNQEVLDSLRAYASLYFHGHSVGGTNPSLLEAMACSVPICANDNAFNRAILDEQAYYFNTPDQLKNALLKVDSDKRLQAWKTNNLQKIRADYQWEYIIEQVEQLFFKALNRQHPQVATEININI